MPLGKNPIVIWLVALLIGLQALAAPGKNGFVYDEHVSAPSIYQWDGNGNLAAKLEAGKVTLYRFDPQNRLIDIRIGSTLAAAQAAIPMVGYSYDAGGNRIKKTTPTGSTGYLIDGNQMYAQVALESTATTSTAYVRGNQLIRQTQGGAGSLFASASPANDLFPLQGHLNTSLGAVDANGNVVEQSFGDAFGQLDSPSGLKQNHLFDGEYWDQDAQLLYLRARWYDPRIGRFISADPFEGKLSDPKSLNRYTFAGNDPVGYSDPSGMLTILDVTFTDFTNSYNKSSDAKRAYQSFDMMRQRLCKGTDFVLSPLLEAHHLVPKFMGGKDDQRLMDVSDNIHHAFHKLLGYMLVLEGFPAPSKGKLNFQNFMNKNANSRDPVNKILLNTAEFVDDACKGVSGYKEIKPAVEQALKVIDIFIF